MASEPSYQNKFVLHALLHKIDVQNGLRHSENLSNYRMYDTSLCVYF